MAQEKPRFYIFHGTDEFRMSQTVNKMRAEMREIDSAGLNLSEFDGSDANAPEVLGAVSAFPFLADRRLVIVRGMLTYITRKGAGETGKKQVQRLLDDLPALPDWARLVFVEPKSINANSKLLKLAQSDPYGYEKEFTVPQNLTQWLMRQAKSDHDTALEPSAAQALSSVVSGDLRRADNELSKLASYAGGDPITENMVALLTPYTPETRIWDMIDAMAAGRGDRAMTMLHNVLDEPNEDPFRVWALVVRQFRLMLLAKEHLDGGGSSATLADAMGMKAFQVKKLPGQVSRFTLDDLETIYRKLLEYDTNVKTGKMNILLALDTLVATIA
ncbi:MAG: DNA polymerase III subunit delta [Chloroflexota bacterium]